MVAPTSSLRMWLMGFCALVFLAVFLGSVAPNARALPAFARKYEVNCHVCHTRWPRLNSFGEQFLENGYQLPGTADGGLVGKLRYGDLTLDEVSNYLAFLLDLQGVNHTEVKREGSAFGQDQTEFATPVIFRLFTAGTLTENVGFLVDASALFEESSDIELGRAFMTFNNLGGMNWGHLRIGRLDPSSYFSVATARPQFIPVGPKVGGPGGPFGPTITRWGLLPSAFASKFYGLFDQSGDVIFPFQSTLYHSAEEIGIDLHGRPFGNWFLYQIGILNGADEDAGDSNNSKDWYVMARLDYGQSHLFSANLSGFAYFGNHNAKLVDGTDVSRTRYGVAARVRYAWLDLYGVYTIDRVTDLPDGMGSTFDDTATGLTIEAHAIATNRLMVGLRYDHMDAGGVLSERKSATFVGAQIRYYLRSNIALQVRDEVNVRDAEDGTYAARNLRNFFGVNIFVAY